MYIKMQLKQKKNMYKNTFKKYRKNVNNQN